MRLFVTVVACVLLAWTGVAKAEITSWWCANDGDGAINCVTNGWSYDGPSQTYTLSVAGSQFWGPGHMLMTFTTDGATDPTIHTLNYVTNDTSVPWAAYQLLITLDTNAPLTSSSLTDVTVSSPNEDWTFVPPSEN